MERFITFNNRSTPRRFCQFGSRICVKLHANISNDLSNKNPLRLSAH